MKHVKLFEEFSQELNEDLHKMRNSAIIKYVNAWVKGDKDLFDIAEEELANTLKGVKYLSTKIKPISTKAWNHSINHKSLTKKDRLQLVDDIEAFIKTLL